MLKLSKALLYVNTMRYLRPVQIHGRLWRNLTKPKPGLSPPPEVRPALGARVQPAPKYRSLHGPSRFRFLNEEHDILSPADWNHAGWADLWLYNLHYFDDLNAPGADVRGQWHRSLLARWVSENPPGEGIGWDPYPTSLRIVNWIKWVLAGNELPADCVHSLGVQARWLRKRLEWHILGNHLLANAKALVFAGCFFEGAEADAMRAVGLRILDGQLDEQVMPDGGHFELSPMYHKRTLDYMSYMVAAILASPFVRKADVVVGTSPHIFTAIAAYVVGVLKGIPFVFELRDLWPEQIRAVGALKNVPGLRVVENPVLRLLERLELFLYRKAALIVAVTSAFKKNLTDRGIAASKVLVISNGIDLSRYSPQPKDEELTRRLGLDGKFVTGYMGTHGMSQGLDTVLDAAKIMADRADGNRYAFLMIGDGAEKARLAGRCRALGLRNMLFLDTVPKKEVVRYWSLFDACIVHLRRDPLFTTVIPSKLFEIMGMGIPLIHAVPGESAELVRKERVGVVIPPEDPAAMADAVVRLAVDSNLRQSFKERAAKVAPRYDRAEMARLMMRELLALSVPDRSRQSRIQA
jgi:glycosyltransferase involved in cell wall biosynthesis